VPTHQPEFISAIEEEMTMAELLDKRLLDLRGKLDYLRRAYADKQRPITVDIEMQVIEEQIRHLGESSEDKRNYH
jgi:hypothetical protein